MVGEDLGVDIEVGMDEEVGSGYDVDKRDRKIKIQPEVTSMTIEIGSAMVPIKTDLTTIKVMDMDNQVHFSSSKVNILPKKLHRYNVP